MLREVTPAEGDPVVKTSGRGVMVAVRRRVMTPGRGYRRGGHGLPSSRQMSPLPHGRRGGSGRRCGKAYLPPQDRRGWTSIVRQSPRREVWADHGHRPCVAGGQGRLSAVLLPGQTAWRREPAKHGVRRSAEGCSGGKPLTRAAGGLCPAAPSIGRAMPYQPAPARVWSGLPVSARVRAASSCV